MSLLEHHIDARIEMRVHSSFSIHGRVESTQTEGSWWHSEVVLEKEAAQRDDDQVRILLSA